MLDAPHLPERGVDEGSEGDQLRHVVELSWVLGIPVMFGVSVLVLYIATGSAVWTLVVAAWGGVVAGPYFGGFVLLNRGELAKDREAELDVVVLSHARVAHPPAA